MDVNSKIASMYGNIGYLGMYGTDVFITIVLFVITTIIVGHSSYQTIILELQNNWNTNKCNPIVMPFAGIIMPKPGQSIMDTTFENFNYCIQQDVSSIFSIIMMPLEFVLYLTIEILNGILRVIAAFIEFLAWLKSQISGIFTEIFQKIISFLIPILEITVHIQDALGKVNGILITGLYTAMTIYNITVSGIINIMNILVNIINYLY
jgi:phage-related protein